VKEAWNNIELVVICDWFVVKKS